MLVNTEQPQAKSVQTHLPGAVLERERRVGAAALRRRRELRVHARELRLLGAQQRAQLPHLLLQRLVLLLHALQLRQPRAHAVQRGLQLYEALLAPLAVALLRLRAPPPQQGPASARRAWQRRARTTAASARCG